MSENKSHKKRSLGWYALLLIVTVSVIVFVAIALWRTFAPNPDVWTNNAKIDAHYTVVAPRVQGQVREVLINDNAQVHAGQPLVRLDSSDYQITVAIAQAKQASAKAALSEIKAEIARQPARIAKAQAVLEKDKADARFARNNAERANRLARSNSIPEEEHQRRLATADSAEALVAADQTEL